MNDVVEMFSLRQKWAAVVAKLVFPHSPDKATDAILAYLPLLADLPDAAFTHRSAEAVATSTRRLAIPAYDELSTALRAWWRDNRPRQQAIGQEKPHGWNETDEVWLAYWRRREAEGFALIPNMVKPPGGYTWREHVASMVRCYSLKAWSVIERERA